MHQITSVVSTGSPPLTFDWEDIMNSSSFVHYVRDQVIFISMTTIATILLFTLGLMAAASLDGKAREFKKNPWPVFLGLAVIVQVGVAYALISAFTA